MKVKDLRDYLSLHDISTEMCREKEELVLLVLGQQPVVSQEGRTRAPALSPGFLEQQAFLTQPHASTVPPTSPSLPSVPAQATSVTPAQAQETQQANGHVSQDQEEPVYLESTARAPAEDETQVGPLLGSVPLCLLFLWCYQAVIRTFSADSKVEKNQSVMTVLQFCFQG